MLKRITISKLFLLLVNLIPLWGVWMAGWNALEIFMVYCLESVIIGLYNILKMSITSFVVKKADWTPERDTPTMVSGPFFILFFLIHYGFFVAIQMSIFISFTGLESKLGVANVWDFLWNFKKYLSQNSLLLLLGFVISYGLIMLKDFIFNGAYKTANLGTLLFQPYGRIFIQQFTVIVGSLFIGLGNGQIFITVFVAIRIYFDVFLNFDRIIKLIEKRQAMKSAGRQQ